MEVEEGQLVQEITKGMEGPKADDISGIVKATFIDDGDDFEMDAAIRGIKGESSYPDRRCQEPPPYKPPGGEPPSDSEETHTGGGEETEKITGNGGWTPPDVSIQELMASEPAAMFYNHTVPEVVASERKKRSLRRRANRIQRIADLRPKTDSKKSESK